jgi:5-methylcytosine-specific restriction endonuclease McrA
MARPVYSRCADHEVVPRWSAALSRERSALSDSLGYLGEIDERQLYRWKGYDSVFEFCLGEGNLCEGAAYKRIRAARAAKKFPVLLDALEDGRLHLSAVVMLAGHFTPETVAELVTAATHRTKAQIEDLLAQRFPRPDVATSIRPLPGPASAEPLSPGTVHAAVPASAPVLPDAVVAMPAGAPACPTPAQLSPGTVVLPECTHLPASMVPPAPRTKVTPLAPERYELRTTLDQETHDLLREAQALLGHAIPDRDAAQVLKRVLQDWVAAQRRRKFGLTDKPRQGHSQANGRYIPAEVKRAVLKRDGGRCTFVGDGGHRCGSRERLEFDHITPVARGGQATVTNLRLRCRAHNQYEAEQVLGAGFMREKRNAARRRAAKSRKEVQAGVAPGAREVVPIAAASA